MKEELGCLKTEYLAFKQKVSDSYSLLKDNNS